MDVQLAEAAAELLLLVEVDLLVAEEDDEVLGERVVDLLELLVAERLREVDAFDLGADHRAQGYDANGLIRHWGTAFRNGWRHENDEVRAPAPALAIRAWSTRPLDGMGGPNGRIGG